MFFFFNDTATTEIYTLSLHDALPISSDPGDRAAAPVPVPEPPRECRHHGARRRASGDPQEARADRKSTRLNSSHVRISYAVFCLKKKNKEKLNQYINCGRVSLCHVLT